MTGSRVIHSDDLPWETGGHGDLFAHRRRRLGREAGGHGLGCSMMELDPGKTAWPFHYHQANEEALYVLTGEAMLRLGSQRLRVRAGDYVALPTGPEHAHQLTNTSDQVVRYLVISTMVTPEVCVYPDTHTVGVVGALCDDQGQPQRVVTFPRDAEVGYWDGQASPGGAEPREARATESPGEPEAREPPKSGADAEEADDRLATLEQMIESDLEALKRKVARDPSPPPSSSSSSSSDMADRDLEDLKRTLDD